MWYATIDGQWQNCMGMDVSRMTDNKQQSTNYKYHNVAPAYFEINWSCSQKWELRLSLICIGRPFKFRLWSEYCILIKNIKELHFCKPPFVWKTPKNKAVKYEIGQIYIYFYHRPFHTNNRKDHGYGIWLHIERVRLSRQYEQCVRPQHWTTSV